jgi:hypothetical protein
MWNLISVCLVIVLVSVQDRCTVCAKRTIASEILSDTPNATSRDMGMWNLVLVCLEIVLVSVQDSFMVGAERTIGSEIISGAPNKTPR